MGIKKKERGITLVALILTVIILVILSAVGISVVYNSRIIEFAINGAMKYGQEGINENKVLEGTENKIDSVVENIKGIEKVPTPVISILEVDGENGWYRTEDVTIEIKDVETETNLSPVKQIVYILDGTETSVEGRIATVKIDTDGIHKIKAYSTYGSKKSEETEEYIIKRDVADPNKVELEASTEVTISSFKVTVVAQDVTSGIKKLKFELSTMEDFSAIIQSQEYTIETVTTEEIRQEHTFSGLNVGNPYYVRVIATDEAGRTGISNTVAQATKTNGMSSSDLSKTTEIGKYVNYVPSGSAYTVSSNYSGTGADQTFSANNSMKWRIWGVEENKLLLISETVADKIELKGLNGYNNGVKILNDACSTAFGNSRYGSAIKVRSINQDDIDKVTKMTTDAQKQVANSGYGSSHTPSNYYWPNIYGQEPGKAGGGSLNRSSQSSWIRGSTKSSFTGKWTFYNYNITYYATQTIYDALLTNMSASSTSGTDSHTKYWVASRCVTFDYYDTCAFFGMFCIINGSVVANHLYTSENETRYLSGEVRPMVEVNLDSIEVGITGLGTASSPYSMAKK